MSTEYLCSVLETEVRAGYLSLDEILEGIPELLEVNEGQVLPDLEELLIQFVHEKMERQLELEAEWQSESTNDRIDRAFKELSEAGIIAVQNAGFEWDSGWDAVMSYAEEQKIQGRSSNGGVFFHGQDVMRGVLGEGLWLMFGALEATLESKAVADLRIGQQIMESLRKHDIAATWNGDPNARIRILPFEWRRTRSSRMGYIGSGK